MSAFRRLLGNRFGTLALVATLAWVTCSVAHAQEQSPAVVDFEGQIQILKDADYVFGRLLLGVDPIIELQDISGHIQGVAALDGGRRFVLPTTFDGFFDLKPQMLGIWNGPLSTIRVEQFSLYKAGYTGGAQAAGDVVVVGSNVETRFFSVDGLSQVSELTHLRLECGGEFPALAYHPEHHRYYLATCGKLYASREGRTLREADCQLNGCWQEVKNRVFAVHGWFCSAGGAALLYDSAAHAMYYVCGNYIDGKEEVGWQNLRIEVTPELSFKGDLDDPVDSKKVVLANAPVYPLLAPFWLPSFRWGGTMFVDENGVLGLVLSQRELKFGPSTIGWSPAVWRGTREVWVQFGYSGTERGTSVEPFDTVAEGVEAVPRYGILKIRTGSANEPMTISKPMKIVPVGGPVRLGPG